MEALAAEAIKSGTGDFEEDLDLKAEKALQCPCVAGLREGPCGQTFSDAFVCFIKSTAEEKGSDCVETFVALQACMVGNPDAFASYDEEKNDGKPSNGQIELNMVESKKH